MAVEISARGLSAMELGEKIEAQSGPVVITGCLGQRFIGAGMRTGKYALKAYPATPWELT